VWGGPGPTVLGGGSSSGRDEEPTIPESTTPAGWYIDPFGQADGRYWNGLVWTDAVSRGGVTIKLPPDPDQATIPPIPGSELRTPTPTPMPLAQPATTPPPPPPPAPRSSAAPVIIGLLVAAAVAAIIFFVVNNDDSDDAPPTTLNTPATGAVTTPPATTPPVTEPPVTTSPATTADTTAP